MNKKSSRQQSVQRARGWWERAVFSCEWALGEPSAPVDGRIIPRYGIREGAMRSNLRWQRGYSIVLYKKFTLFVEDFFILEEWSGAYDQAQITDNGPEDKWRLPDAGTDFQSFTRKAEVPAGKL